MKNDKYELSVLHFCTAIDIAIESLKKYPPKIWNENNFNHVLNVYNEFKTGRINTIEKFKNLNSLKYDIIDAFTFFQESSGESVNYFWAKIKENNLPYRRENKLLKIFKRKKINNDIEYNFVIDVLIPYQQEGLINNEQLVLLNLYIVEFEKRNKK